MKKLKQKEGITLIALIITIIVLLILAGVTINMLTGDNGILKNAQLAALETRAASVEEKATIWKTEILMAKTVGGTAKSLDGVLQEMLDEGLLTEEEVKTINLSENKEITIGSRIISFNTNYVPEIKTNKPNAPVMLTGMSPIKFTDPTESTKGTVVETNTSDSEWYNYEAKKWANAQTEDGSMWVWIPRYAYRLDSTSQTADIVFLEGKTDNYYDEEGNIQTAKRATSAEDVIDTTTEYTVHPAFTDESSAELNYANGGWDEELTGIWVAKFEAGYASGNNSVTPTDSSVSYTQASAYLQAAENGGSNATGTARNYLDGVYGELNGSTYEFVGGTAPKIDYPVFLGSTFAMNYINHNDAYNIAKALTEENNIYGLVESNADSHLMKNSEWGAVAYLSQSKYGLDGTNIYINNVNLHSSEGATSVYAATGCSGIEEDAAVNSIATVADINGTIGNTASNNVYTWNQKDGQRASSTGTMYGIYDLSGGTWERTTGYVARGHANLQKYGESVAYDEEGNLKTTSTKYTTVYPYNETYDSSDVRDTTTNLNTASAENYKLNTKIYGDAIRETSIAGTGSTSWYDDYSHFPGLHYPFSFRGGGIWHTSYAGLFSFHRDTGASHYSIGFRAVLVAE